MGGAGSGGRPRIVLGAALALACANPGLLETPDGRLHHSELGFAIASPDAVSPGWKRARLAGADLAYRRPGALMSLQAACGKPLAQPRILAWHLMIGSKRTLRRSQAVELGPLEGWTLTFDTLLDGVAVRVKTVTLVHDRCSYDWILSANHGFEESEPSFDAWWRSFEPDPRPAPPEVEG